MIPRKIRFLLVTPLLLAALVLGKGMGMAHSQLTSAGQVQTASHQLVDGPDVVVGHH